MIDIHSHLLPGLDDGARTIDESVAMLRIAAANGTTDIVATPHASPEFPFRAEVVAERAAQLRAMADGLVRIHTGCDLHLSYENIRDAIADPLKYTINGKGYLLVEFSDLLIPKNMEDVFARMLSAGITPVITHPERNWAIRKQLKRLEEWVEEGCLFQVTAQSLLGRFGSDAKRSGLDLLKRGLVHFVASDAHDTQDRPPRLDEAFALVSRKFGLDYARQLFVSNPKAALSGEPLEAPEPPVLSHPLFRFWR